MVAGRIQVMETIDSEWTNLQEAIANVPAEKLEGIPVLGTWSVKDLMGHITTWEDALMDNIRDFFGPALGKMASYPDPDAFNERTSNEKRPIPLMDIQRDLAETHSKLLDFLRDLPESAFAHDEVDRRIRLDTYGHYPEHAASLREFAVLDQG